MYHYFIIYKPHGVISKFTPEHKYKTLGEVYPFPKNVYPVGRLDTDSEGLLLLTDDKKLNHALLNPLKRHERTYWVQVEGAIDNAAIAALEKGVTISIEGNLYNTLPAKARIIEPPAILPERFPPVRYRKNIPTTWIELKLVEGKNRQVRRMTAKVGHPTLRLVRASIENLHLNHITNEKIIQPGSVKSLSQKEVYQLLNMA